MIVRIPFVISADGKWAAYGYPGAVNHPDWSMVEEVADNGGDFATSYQRGWITVDLPQPPKVVEINGEAAAISSTRDTGAA